MSQSFEDAEFWRQPKPKKVGNVLVGMSGITGKQILEKQKIREMTRDRDQWSWDFWYGVSSGFPLCCILWYCDIWTNVRKAKRMFSGRPEVYDWNSGSGRVLCPECLIREVSKRQNMRSYKPNPTEVKRE